MSEQKRCLQVLAALDLGIACLLSYVLGVSMADCHRSPDFPYSILALCKDPFITASQAIFFWSLGIGFLLSVISLLTLKRELVFLASINIIMILVVVLQLVCSMAYL